MMINKRLIGAVPESKKYIAGNVALQWCSLCANIAMMSAVTALLAALFAGEVTQSKIVTTAVIALAAVAVRYGCTVGASRMGYLSSKAVKKTLRGAIYDKLLCLGASYSEQVKTSEVVQVAVEGVDQLETYFGAYLPQFFYAMLAPLTLFVVLCFVSVPAAVVLLVCVPLIPVAIAAVQTWAKKLLSKYWGQYTALGDTFLENLQGLTTLKIYQADAFKNDEMNVEAEKFRKITMKVLTMQLNSITIMDLIAYGGTALGVIMAATQLRAGKIDLAGALLIILLAADFFIPMRQLGSFFHIAMNGMAASDKIFRLLDLSEPAHGGVSCPAGDIVCRGLRFSYEPEREILHGVDLTIPQGKFVSLVGESGCGKSTISALLMGRNKGYTGSMTVGGAELRDIEEASLMRRITYVSHAHRRHGLLRRARENELMKDIETKREREKKMISQMIALYCRRNHHTKGVLCPECAALNDYAHARSEHCPFMETKTFCVNCRVHCYKPDMREKIRAVMRFSGPRMIFYHPVAAIRHVVETKREKKRLKRENR